MKIKMRFMAIAAVLSVAMVTAGMGFAATLDDVKARGELKCGVGQQLPGFAFADSQGNFRGFDVDFCRATAAAIGVKVKFFPLSAKERFPALQSGEVDVLWRNTTWTFSRDVNLGFDFAGVNYYDGQGFMVRKSLGVKNAKELDGATVCMNAGTTTELNLATYFRAHKMKFEPVLFEKSEEVRQAYEAGRCDIYTTDASGMAAQRSAMKNPGEHVILPEIISKEPLGPVTRQGDSQWNDVVRWVLNALIIAEELGVTQSNAQSMGDNSTDPTVRGLLGKSGTYGEDLGLTNAWALNAIKAVGNYGEIFERNIGKNTPLGLERGLNALWTDGGLQYAPPIR
jgi:general L-amino acid transport system substrate-binding protein